MYSKYSWLALGVTLLAASGCFSPEYTEGMACSEQGRCPEGMACGLDGHCWLPGRACTTDMECASGVCDTATGTCADAACDDGVRNGGETDTDCGGGCAPCGDGLICGQSSDCQSQVCEGDVCAAPRCGDGVVNQSGEVCDEGGPTATCTADCLPASCGDGVVDPGEDCDEGGESAACNADCTVAGCGDGIVNMTAGEQCDEGGESAACNANCTVAQCGDGIANASAGEQCDDGNASNKDNCLTTCVAASCGDGFLWNQGSGTEQCDDEGTSPGDGCSATCRLEFDRPPILVVWDHALFPAALGDLLATKGFRHATRSNGSARQTSDLDQLLPFRVVIFYNDNRLISAQEHAVLNQYVARGGKLLVTGYDSTGSPTDPLLADVARVITSGDYRGQTECTVTNDSYPPLSGPQGVFSVGSGFAVTQADHDRVQADTARGAVELIAVGEAAKLTVAGNVGPGGGTVWYWNGNAGGSDWTTAGTAQRVFLNLLHDAAGYALADVIVTGIHHTCALDSAGAVRCWGRNYEGQLGYGHTQSIGDNELPSTAGPVDVGGTVVQLAAGALHTCALLDTGAVRCWGYNYYGQLGYGHTSTIGDNELPSAAGDVDLGGSAVQITAGGNHTCALLDTGALRCWGNNGQGQLGYGHTLPIGDNEPPSSAGDVSVGGTAVQITAGGYHTCALLDTGALRCWGWNIYGQLGYGHILTIGDNGPPSAAGDVSLGGRAAHVDAGWYHTCALLDTGAVLCWGHNGYGQLGYGHTSPIGDNELPSSAGPVSLGGTATQLASSYYHTCALLSSGALRCWGYNSEGQLGYGHTLRIGDNELPSSVGEVSVGGAVAQMAAGMGLHTCALLYTGGVRCWGYNGYGQLGYGHTSNIGDNELPSSAGDVPYQ